MPKSENACLAQDTECPICLQKILHAPEEMARYHPFAGHGFVRETGWSHPDLIPKAAAK